MIDRNAVASLIVPLCVFTAACGGASGASSPTYGPSGVSHGTLSAGDQQGTYRLFRPPSLDPKHAAPLIVALHGASFGGDKMAAIGNWDAAATADGFIAAFPDWGWHVFSTSNGDVALISSLLDRIEHEYTIDKARIFIVGASAGAEMSYTLACELSDRISAIASVLGDMVDGDCRPSRAVSILELHGTNDDSIPYDYAVDAIRSWVALDGCANNPQLSLHGITKTSTWTGCRNQTVVTFDTVVGGQHRWFGSTVEVDLAPVSGEPDATAVVWDFFSNLAPRA